MMSRSVFIAGSTGYMGQRLSAQLAGAGHAIQALCRPGSESKAANECTKLSGDPLHPETFANKVPPCDTWVHLVGVAHPSPRKAALFKAIDWRSVEACVPVAVTMGIKHFVYVSVAHPAPMMHAYIEVRSRCEEIIRQSGLNATILRPWYVLGPGHHWPYLLKPICALFERVPSTAASAKRLGLVTLPQMIRALVHAVENPATGVRIIEVPDIRTLAFSPSASHPRG